MSEELLFGALEQIKSFDSPDGGKVKNICFTGGEPFLFYYLVKSGVVRAKELGFSTEVCTNGFWGNLPDDQISERLDGLPIDRITISTDYFHDKFVPEPVIYNLMRFVKGRNVRCTLRIGETPDAAADRFIVKVGAYKYMTNLVIHPFMRIGRAESIREENFFRPPDVNNARCPAGECFTIRFDGEVFPCGGPIWAYDALSCGNLSNDSLSDILNSGIAKEFSLITEGKTMPGQVAKNARIADLPDKCSGACEICLTLFSQMRGAAVPVEVLCAASPY
jgi:MoaA/NifB/PqqE/SkfB family radical SAM enzyme